MGGPSWGGALIWKLSSSAVKGSRSVFSALCCSSTKGPYLDCQNQASRKNRPQAELICTVEAKSERAKSPDRRGTRPAAASWLQEDGTGHIPMNQGAAESTPAWWDGSLGGSYWAGGFLFSAGELIRKYQERWQIVEERESTACRRNSTVLAVSLCEREDCRGWNEASGRVVWREGLGPEISRLEFKCALLLSFMWPRFNSLPQPQGTHQ